MPKFPIIPLIIVLLIAAIGRALLLVSGAVSFHSDEAVVALMARHINAGARPVFFYGQAYMGSLDAWLVALGFRIFGEQVMSIRIVQSALYLLVVATAYGVGWQVSGRWIVAAVTGLAFALPSALVATYTTATLGGYNEVLLLGNILLICGYRVVFNDSPAHRFESWGLIGLAAGLGWWANGLIIMYVLPVAGLGLIELIRRIVRRDRLMPYAIGILIAALGFLIGSAPWWGYNFEHDFAALKFYVSGDISGTPDPARPKTTMGDHALGMILFGLPTVVGMRFSWLSSYFAVPAGLLVITVYVLALYRLARANPLRRGGRALILLMIGLFCLIFVISPFGADPTGRYFLPLVLPLAVTVGTLVDSVATLLREKGQPLLLRWAVPGLVAALVLGYQLAGQVSAVNGDYGLTTQFDLITHVPNDHDSEVIEFLQANDLYHGHTNYWVAYRLAFLSGEALQYKASLPYKADLSYNDADQRYQLYTAATDSAARIAYITTLLPQLDDLLMETWQAAGVAYTVTAIGEYRIYHEFSAPPPHPNFDN